MSETLIVAVGPTSKDDVHVGSFSGGSKGQCIQIDQGLGKVVQLDRAQVKAAVVAMEIWLGRPDECVAYGRNSCVNEATETVDGVPACGACAGQARKLKASYPS